MKTVLVILISLISFSSHAQNNFSCIVKDSESKELLIGVTAKIKGSAKATASGDRGIVHFTNLPGGTTEIVFSLIGYEAQTVEFQIPQSSQDLVIYMKKADVEAEEEVIISSTRTNSRIEDLPTKVEVLGSEEVDEEAGTIPGNIASLLGDIAGIQNQRTSGTTASIDLRVQGLPGKYTQILRDGLPLFGGYSGSFSVLQIPPLDLKQVEIIKGASSTLYGGGAIAGMINLISKTPKLNDPQHSILINYSTLNEFNLNTFHSRRNNKTGYTFFAGTTQQRAKDVNKDGFSDVPDLKSFFFHPKLFVYPNEKNTVTLEFDGTYEDRNGGDMQVLHKTKDSAHQFFIQNRSLRNSIAGTWENKISKNAELNFKGLLSFFNRDITTNVFGMKANQRTYFTELSYLKKWDTQTLVSGINVSGETFSKRSPDSSGIDPYSNIVLGVFIQDDWKITQKLTAQTGIRFDYNSMYVPVLLPRLSLLYKINTHFTTRLGGGMGYKAPSVFTNDVDEREMANHNLAPGIIMERSAGANWDINFKQKIIDWSLTVNQMFYFTRINHPVIADANGGPYFNYINAAKPLNTNGFETYVAVMHSGLEMYLGYTYTIAKQLYDPVQPVVPLSARSKFAAFISNEFSERFRACIEASYTGRQFLDNGSKTPGYLVAAGMIRYDIHKLSLVLNCENIFDYRQTRKESIVFGPTTNPSFKQLWAPVDGRVLNLSARINF
ncbi:MAG TPA: TonB-dependent receptor [Ferruginibacter sp.]|jgi:outer membrane receptor protein involved in Fe transport|nr:TonB-dependent receptor [Ferruginibacter sp.]